jgi:hypothetical protein
MVPNHEKNQQEQLMMRNRWKLPLTLMVWSAATFQAQAAIKDWLPEPKIKTEGLKSVYAGVGLTSDLLHFSAESPTAYGTVYAKAGSFLGGADKAAGQVGFRYPYHLTGTDQNGYYLGGFVGHIESASMNREDYNRLGAGLELSYVWLNRSRLSAASIALGVGERKKGSGGQEDKPQPKILFGYTFNFGIY